jgi:TatD DNase family protein
MIDTHCHLHHAQFEADRAAARDRAFAAGLSALLEVNIDAAGWARAAELAATDRRIFLTVGIHPHDTGRAGAGDLDRLADHLGHERVRAVGETGLDYFRDYAPHDVQRDFFRRHVSLARESGLPLVVHARERAGGPSAHADIFRILEEEGRGRVRGVLHCFSGDLEVARRAAAIGFRLGIGGAVTYSPERSGALLAAIAGAVGPEIFVLETDCPYLGPVPRRGRRNEPANLPLIAEALGRYLGASAEEIGRMTDASADDLFGLGIARDGGAPTSAS